MPFTEEGKDDHASSGPPMRFDAACIKIPIADQQRTTLAQSIWDLTACTYPPNDVNQARQIFAQFLITIMVLCVGTTAQFKLSNAAHGMMGHFLSDIRLVL